MLVLFDHGTPRTLARYLIDHHMRGLPSPCAEEAGFEVPVTTGQNLSYQQNLTSRKIAIVVLGKGRWGLIKPHIPEIVAAVSAAAPGSFAHVEISYPPR